MSISFYKIKLVIDIHFFFLFILFPTKKKQDFYRIMLFSIMNSPLGRKQFFKVITACTILLWNTLLKCLEKIFIPFQQMFEKWFNIGEI